MLTHFKNQKPSIILSEAIIKKREALQEKWRDMEDSYEKRDMSTLLFTDCSILGQIDFAILADDIEMYNKYYENEESHWRRHLDLAALCGSRNIGEFIINQKKDILNNNDYGVILGYISSSFNHEWARDLSRNLSKTNAIALNSVYFFCDDYDLIEDIKQSFSATSLKVG